MLKPAPIICVATLLALATVSARASAQAIESQGPGRPSAYIPAAPLDAEPTIIPRSAEAAMELAPPKPIVTRLQSPDPNSVRSESAADSPNKVPSTGTNQLVRQNSNRETGEKRSASEFFDDFDAAPIKTLGSALAVVVGLMLVSVWVMKKASPRSVKVAPNDVAKVIGRVPLSAKQQAHLLHLGNKILLVSITPAGSETLGEIDDPAEVQRVLAECTRNESSSAQAAFEDVFKSFGRESVSGFLDGQADNKGANR